MLIQAIHVNLRACISQYYAGEEKPISEDEKETGKLLLDLFRLDDRSGLTPKDKSLDDLRVSYHKEPFRWSRILDLYRSEDQPTPDVLFVADAEVLRAVEASTYILKCVDVDFYQRNHKPYSRVTRSYWGWIPVTPLAVLHLWQEMNRGGFTLENVARSARSEDTIRAWTDYDSTVDWGATGGRLFPRPNLTS